MDIVEKLCDFFTYYGVDVNKEDLMHYDKEMYENAQSVFDNYGEAEFIDICKANLAAARNYRVIDVRVDKVYDAVSFEIYIFSVVVYDLARGVVISNLNNRYIRY